MMFVVTLSVLYFSEREIGLQVDNSTSPNYGSSGQDAAGTSSSPYPQVRPTRELDAARD
jgi:hypothetical protein